MLTGASAGPSLDDALAEADAISWRAPFQSSAPLRTRINDGRVAFVDMHLSHVPQAVLAGHFGPIQYAVVEATQITPAGEVSLSTSVGASPAFLAAAERVVIELNRRPPRRVGDLAQPAVFTSGGATFWTGCHDQSSFRSLSYSAAVSFTIAPFPPVLGQGAPIFTHATRSATCSAESLSFSFGGIAVSLSMRFTALMSALRSGFPGTIAGPPDPPLSNPSRLST